MFRKKKPVENIEISVPTYEGRKCFVTIKDVVYEGEILATTTRQQPENNFLVVSKMVRFFIIKLEDGKLIEKPSGYVYVRGER